MLQNAYLPAKIGADTAENERNSAENLPKIGKAIEVLLTRPAKTPSRWKNDLDRAVAAAIPQVRQLARSTASRTSPNAGCRGMRQNLAGSFSAVSKPNFASKYAFESSRRDLHNALLCTAPKSHFFQKICRICQNLRKFSEFK